MMKTKNSNDVYDHACIGYMCRVCEDADRWVLIHRLKSKRDADEARVAALTKEVERLRDERSRADRAWLVGAPHGGADACPTFYDGCHCTVDTLDHNCRRAEAAEAALSSAREEAARRLIEALECVKAACDRECAGCGAWYVADTAIRTLTPPAAKASEGEGH